MELIDFTNTQKVLEEFAGRIADKYRANLEASGRFTENRELINSVTTNVVIGEKEWAVTMTLRHYWKYVEEGVQGDRNAQSPYRNPGWKAFPHIMNWVEIKPQIPKPSEGLERERFVKSLAYLVTRSIVQHGTQGSHDLKRAKEDVMAEFKERITDALTEDVGFYIRKVISG